MATVHEPDAFEQALFKAADFFGFDLAWEMLQCTPPSQPTPPPFLDPTALPLVDWVRVQASWYHQSEAHGSDLIAEHLDALAQIVAFHSAASVAELLSVSARLRQCDLSAIETPTKRPMSLLSDIIDAEVEGYLVLGGDAARLAAWWLLDLSEDCDFFHADTAEQLRVSRDDWNREHDNDGGTILF